MDLSASSSHSAFSGSARVYIDTLLQDTYLFVMDIHHQPALVRDEGLYNRAVKLMKNVTFIMPTLPQAAYRRTIAPEAGALR